MTQETEQFLIRMIETCEDAGMRKARQYALDKVNTILDARGVR